ncbi:MAG: ABC transporter permease [Acidobacteriia bacterium]|nr:ABC transporter permease [Terriglobia bacterium]MYG01120.1 ABC transporter permease [Terriglobia bacterium]MYK11650.1 ABC transporter permease [Terriglobia bacterium]
MSVLQDLRYALRMLARAPVYTAVVVATLALGIGANTAIYSLVVATVLRSAPYGESERLVAVWTHWIGSSALRTPSSCPDLLDWRDRSEVFEEYGYFFPRRTYNMGGSDLEPQQVLGGRMSASLLPMLRVSPVLGRNFLPEEDVEGARTVAMLTYGFWRQQFGGDPDIIGKSVRLDQVPFEIVGVLPEEFHIESPAPKLWVPFSQEGAVESFGRQVSWLNVIGRLNPGISVGQASAALEIISASNREQFPETNERRGVFVEPLSDALAAESKESLYLIWVAAGLVLLIACVNVANLMLGRLAARGQEVAVRAAIGAGRGRLARQFLTESLVLAALGGVAGFCLAVLQLGPLVAVISRTLWDGLPPYLQDVSVDVSALVFALVITCVTGLLFGSLPALMQSQSRVTARMSAGDRAKGSRSLVRNVLVVAQTALSITLLVGVGVSLSAYLRAEGSELGFPADEVAVLQVELPRTQYAVSGRMEAGRRIWAILPSVETVGLRLRERLAAIPGVREVGLSSQAPPYCCRGAEVEVLGGDQDPRAYRYPRYQTISPTYFDALGIPIIQGRAFQPADGQNVAIVNRSYALRRFGQVNPVGQTLLIHGWNPHLKNAAVIVGVVADSLISPWQIEGALPQFYLPYAGQAEESPGNMRTQRLTLSYLIRTAGDPASIFGEAKLVVAEELGDLPVAKLATLESEFAGLLRPAQMMASLLGGLSLLAVLLTAIGLYGVVAYSVGQRKREFGVRLALGEVPRRLMLSVLQSSWRLTGYGILCGGVAVFALVPVMEAQIYLVDGDQFGAFLVMALVLLGVATIAGFLPAWSASNLDPINVLRDE